MRPFSAATGRSFVRFGSLKYFYQTSPYTCPGSCIASGLKHGAEEIESAVGN